MGTIRNSKGEEFDVSDVDAVRMAAEDPSLKVVGDLAITPDKVGNATISEQAGRVLATTGATPASATDVSAFDRKNYLQDKTSVAGASLRGGLSGLTAGFSDDLFNPETIEADEAHHSFARGASSIVGAVAPALFGDEAGLGGLFRSPVEAERAAGGLSSKFMLAGEAGADAGTTEKLVEQGLARSGKDLDAIKGAAATPLDLSTLDAKGLREAREAELDSLAGGHASSRVASRSAAVDDALAYRQSVQEANPFLVASEGSASAPLAKSTRTIRNAMDDLEGLRESPGSLLKPLRQQAQALEQTIAEREAIAAKFESVNSKVAKDLAMDLDTLPDAATHVELTGKAAKRYAAYADVRVGKDATLQVARDDAQGFLEALKNGEVTGQGQAAMDKLQGLLEQNKALQGKLKGATGPALARSELTSARLTAIDAARDALATPQTKSLAEQMLGGSIMGHVAGSLSGLPVIGPMLGAKVGQFATDVVFGRLGKSVGESAAKSAAAVKSFLGRVALTPTVPVVATRTLARVQYAPQRQEHGSDLAGLFKARTDELKSQTAYGPDGKPVMTQDARLAMASRLDPIRAVDPIAADQLETITARKVEFLSSVIPRRPDIGGLPTGPDRWQPSDMEMRTFARYCDAAERPDAVEQRVAAGTVTPEDVEAYHAIYPERAEAFKQQVISELPKLRQTLPFAKRISFSIFTGVPVDPAMTPNILHVLQDGFASEPNSNGGTEQPKAAPAFGSVKKSVETPTPSQQRAG